MSITKNAIIRYHALDKCFSNFGRKFSNEDLLQACNEALYNYDFTYLALFLSTNKTIKSPFKSIKKFLPKAQSASAPDPTRNTAVQGKESKLDEKQDACYRKVKSRYKVWPSAYASGALVQCRKKGAANWGNKKK
jgi:hypothetical protein